MLKLCGKNSSVALKYDIPRTYWRFSRRESRTRLKRDKEGEGERAILENGRRGIKRVSDEKVEQVEREASKERDDNDIMDDKVDNPLDIVDSVDYHINDIS